LCEHGGDLRIDSEQSSAKKVAKEKGNKMAEALLGMYMQPTVYVA